MAHLVLMDLQGQQEPKDPQEFLVVRVKLVTLERKDHLDLLANLESQDYPESRVVTVDLEHLDLKVLKGRKETQVQVGHLDPLVLMASMEKEDLLALRERKENLEIREALDPEDHLVWRDPREIQELLAFLDHLENKGPME